jgi:hypothetical protein
LGSGVPSDVSVMLDAVRTHAAGVRAMVATLGERPDPDPARAAALADICRRHADARVVAFSQYAETVRALSRLLIKSGYRVGELTARGGRVAGGRLRRRDALAQFTPGTADAEAAAAERIELLVTTDVLSEGLDLQRASVVVHLDLPWNPARLEQRVGRVRRLGARRDAVHVYAFAPPATAERVLRVENRLRTKLRQAGRIVGLDGTVIPESGDGMAAAPPELASATFALLEGWRDTAALPNARDDRPVILTVAAAAPNDGCLALLRCDGERFLLASVDSGDFTQDPATVDRVCRLCAGTAIQAAPTDIEPALDAIAHWRRRYAARSRLALPSAGGASLRRRIAARIASVLAEAPRHERAILAPIASRARDALRAPLGAGGERALARLARSHGSNVEWLGQIAALGTGCPRRQADAVPIPLVVILLRRCARRLRRLSGGPSPSSERAEGSSVGQCQP